MPPHNESVVGVAGLAEDDQPGTGWVDVDSESLTPESPREENDDRYSSRSVDRMGQEEADY